MPGSLTRFSATTTSAFRVNGNRPVLIAIALAEASRQALLDEIEAAPRRIISSVSLLEAGMVLRARLGEIAVPLLYQLVEELGAEIVSFDGVHARLGVAAFGRFGKGVGHRAQLNFGDCAVYALAASLGEPLLATGNDFAPTDSIVIRP